MERSFTEKLKTITLAADGWDELPELIMYDHISGEAQPYSYKDYPLSDQLLERLKTWYTEYGPLTGLTIKELEGRWDSVDALDSKGMALLKEIGYELAGRLSCRLNYYSRGRDTSIFKMEV